ncbi:MAG: response regulator [Myxococcota bacterium]
MSQESNLQWGRFLVAEDDETLRRLTVRILKSVAIEVVGVGDGEQALQCLIKADPPFDLVITDVMMPKMDGLALLQAIRKNEGTAHTPVIILTAKNDPREVVAGINSGATQYLIKPFKQQGLLDTVSLVLNRRRST